VNLFGQTLDAQQLFQLVSLLMVLAIFVAALRGTHDYARWFKTWEAGRKARRDAEIAAERTGERPENERGGPWGLRPIPAGAVFPSATCPTSRP